MNKMDDIDFDKFTSDMLEDALHEELLKFIGDDPKGAFIFLVGRMIGKFEIMKQISVISQATRTEMTELMNAMKSKEEDNNENG